MVDTPGAMVGLTELNLGIIPGWGGTQRLPLLVGKAKALDMILLSRKISATESLEAGLVNQLSAPGRLMDDARALAEKLAARPLTSLPDDAGVPQGEIFSPAPAQATKDHLEIGFLEAISKIAVYLRRQKKKLPKAL